VSIGFCQPFVDLLAEGLGRGCQSLLHLLAEHLCRLRDDLTNLAQRFGVPDPSCSCGAL
jgi:hypothetical protein